MWNTFKNEVHDELRQTQNYPKDILTKNDISHLPDIVQKYICYTGFIDKIKVSNFKVEFNCDFRSKREETYISSKTIQYNFINVPTRLFYMTAKKMGIPMSALHIYRNAHAQFNVKLFGLFSIINESGQKMDQGETVTVFNDISFFAPGTLVDKRIIWEEIDSMNVRAVYTNEHNKINAILTFNKKGELVNFISDDRFKVDGKKYYSYPWKTPVKEYQNINGYRLLSKGEGVWEQPDGDFSYIKIELKNIQFNCNKFT